MPTIPNTIVEEIKPMAETYKILSTSVTPGEALEKVAMNNPNVKQILDQVRVMNTDPKSMFYAEAHRRGMTDNQIEEALNGLSQSLGLNRPN